MVKWEYEIRDDVDNPRECKRAMTQMGEKGWEAFHVDGIIVWYKRMIV